ncbi:MAG: phosphotransferase [Clostridia bacterium]|nr:phosphotransferase [Deltaproteobacteria bacterium]
MSLVPQSVRERYGFEHAMFTPITAGHLNQTLRVDVDGARFILQCLNTIFGAEIHEDIYAVTEHLTRAGLITPRLFRTRDGELFVRDERVYRVFTFVEGATHLKSTSPVLCQSAAALLGQFHTALLDLQHVFVNKRGNIHGPQRHADHLRRTLEKYVAHEHFSEVSPIADEILAGIAALPPFESLPTRVVHGDPKISNVLFGARDEALCLVDLDTLYPSNIAFELGDAFRSWCNPFEEDDASSHIDLAYFEAGVGGYAAGAGSFVTREEAHAITLGVEAIALELAARFTADALEESYFGWDTKRFKRSAEHNLARGKGQLAIARSVQTRRDTLQGIVESAFAETIKSRNFGPATATS